MCVWCVCVVMCMQCVFVFVLICVCVSGRVCVCVLGAKQEGNQSHLSQPVAILDFLKQSLKEQNTCLESQYCHPIALCLLLNFDSQHLGIWCLPGRNPYLRGQQKLYFAQASDVISM